METTRNVTTGLGVVAVVTTTQTMILVAIPLAGLQLGLRGYEIGWLVAIPALASLVFDIPVAVASDSRGRRLVLMVAGLVGASSAAAFVSAPGPISLIIADVGLGLYLSFAVGSVLAYLTEVAPDADQPRIQSYNGATQFGSALLGALASGIVLDMGGAPAALALVGSLALSVTFLAALSGESSGPLRRVRPRDLASAYERGFGLLASRPRLCLASAVTTTHGAHLAVIGNAFVPLLIVHGLGESPTLAGAALGIRSAVAGTTSLSFATIKGRLGLLAPMVGSGALAAFAVLMFGLAPNYPLLVLLLGLQGIGIGLAPATSNILVAGSTARAERALGFAAQAAPARVGNLMLPLLLGLTLDRFGLAAVFLVAAVTTGAYAAVIAILTSSEARRGTLV